MKNDFKGRENFLRELGLFNVEFSKLEFGLLDLCTMTSEYFPAFMPRYIDYIGDSLETKRKTIKSYLNKNLPDLLPEWTEINVEIGLLNEERRHLVHGVGQAYLFHESISTYVKKKDRVEKKEYTVKDIKALTNRVAHVNTGKNGICGVFHFTMKTAVIDLYNENVPDGEKKVFRVNNEIRTKWKVA